MRINREGYRIIGVTALVIAAILFIAAWWLPVSAFYGISILGILFFIFVVSFFRKPQRPFSTDGDLVFSPADGTIVAAEMVTEREYFGDSRIQVSVFMSLTNVHMNWYPVGGEITYFRYHPGKFLVAWHPKSSEKNERTTTVVRTTEHGEVLFRQIAGFIARRIVSYAAVGGPAVQNTKCGFIKFGSRVDVLLPAGSELLVSIGDKVVGSQTPLARLK